MGGRLHIVFDVDLRELFEGHHVIAHLPDKRACSRWRIDDLPSLTVVVCQSAITALHPRYGGGVDTTLPGEMRGFTVTTSLADIGTLRHAAMEMIAEAWGVLAADHIVPCSRYRPYIQVGRDYEGTALMGGSAFAQFSGRLETLYPEWFEAAPGASPRWYAQNLACSFVDACVAELSLRGETGDAPSDAVEAMVLELVDYLDAPEARVACARRVSHLMTQDREEISLASVTILAHRKWQEIRQIAEVMPTARSAFNGDPPRSFANPEATLVSYTTGSDPFELPADAERRIDRLLLAVRLLSGATTASIYQVTGETTSVCRYAARLDVIPYDGHPVPVRPAVISLATVRPVEGLLALYDATEHRAPGEGKHSGHSPGWEATAFRR